MNQLVAVQEHDPQSLPIGTRLLNGQYEILQHLQRGGFGIAYVARDSLERRVVIKECFPQGLCLRAGRRVQPVSGKATQQVEALKAQFVREARTMATLRHPHIVAVHQVFEENGSAYMALDLVSGTDLLTVLEEDPGRLTAAYLETALRQALEAIGHIHENGILHRDIAPDNICVNEAGQVVLIDFGAASRTTGGQELAATVLAVKDGYSPYEFYLPGNQQDASSDLYSLGATFYHLITGEAPANCQQRQAALAAGEADPYVALCDGDWEFGHHLLASIDQALKVDRAARYQSAEAWLSALDTLPRERPMRLPKLVFDAHWEEKVIRLVQETNETFGQKPQPEAREIPRLPQVEAMVTSQRQWVDLDGNPIEDIDVWFAEQEREAKLLRRLQDLAARQVDDLQVYQPPAARRRGLSFLFNLSWRSLFGGAPTSAG